MKCNNPNVDIVNINVCTKFCQILSIHSKDIEQKPNSDIKNGRKSVAILPKMMLYTPNMDLVNDNVYVRRKVRIGTIPELSLRKVGILLCPPIPELYRTILELRKGYISCCHRILSVRKVGIGLDKVRI